MQFGTATDSRRPLWAKIERIAAAREAEKIAVGKASKAECRGAMLEARRKHRARVARRELQQHRMMAAVRDANRPERILFEVALKFGVPRDVLTRRVMNRFGARAARHEACWRLYAETAMSTKRISQFLGGIDHTTVLHNVGAWMRRTNAELPAHRVRNA